MSIYWPFFRVHNLAHLSLIPWDKMKFSLCFNALGHFDSWMDHFIFLWILNWLKAFLDQTWLLNLICLFKSQNSYLTFWCTQREIKHTWIHKRRWDEWLECLSTRLNTQQSWLNLNLILMGEKNLGWLGLLCSKK